jgi:hypothetical protein
MDILNPMSAAHRAVDIVLALGVLLWILIYSRAKLVAKLGLGLFVIFVFYLVEYQFPVLLGPSTDPVFATKEFIIMAGKIGFVFYVLFFASD